MSDILVVYYSEGGTTEKVAREIEQATGGDLLGLRPAQPYSEADLSWADTKSRTALEAADAACRPEIANALASVDPYDTVFIGFPVWWRFEPRLIDTFLASYDFTGKKVYPFITADGPIKGVGDNDYPFAVQSYLNGAVKREHWLELIDDSLHAAAKGAPVWHPGKQIPATHEPSVVADWVKTLPIRTA